MIIGYNEKVNKIVIITNDNERLVRKLGVNGLNVCGNNSYSYYDTSMLLHVINMNYVKKVKLYNDNGFVKDLVSVGI